MHMHMHMHMQMHMQMHMRMRVCLGAPLCWSCPSVQTWAGTPWPKIGVSISSKMRASVGVDELRRGCWVVTRCRSGERGPTRSGGGALGGGGASATMASRKMRALMSMRTTCQGDRQRKGGAPLMC